MGDRQTTAVMGGAREAHGLVAGLRAAGLRVVVSLPEPERSFDPVPVAARIGAFGDATDIRGWFRAQEVGAVIDASHVFDHRLSAAVHRAASALHLPYVRMVRPPWRASARDDWAHFSSLRGAVRAMGHGERVFSTTGWASLCDYARFRGDMVFMRQTQTSTQQAGYRFVRFVAGKPPFSCQQEEELYRDLAVSSLICRNFGGDASMSKLDAARRLGLRVWMVDRPPLPAAAPVVASIDGALAWRARL